LSHVATGAEFHGAGIDASNFTRIRNTIVAHQAVGDDGGAAGGSDGDNIDSDDTSGRIPAALGGSDQPGVADAGLLPLADYGGPTRTHALADDSPAVDAGDPAGCMADLNGNGVANVPVATDQRGNVLLEVEDALPDPSGCDVGAVELNLVTNGTMEDDDDDDRIPDGWAGSGLTAADRRYCVPRLAHEGRCYFLLRGDAATAKQLVQELERAGSSGDRHTLSVFAGALDLTGAPRVVVQLDDLQTIGPGEEFELLLPTGSYAYQQLTLSVVATAPSGYDVVRIIVEAGSSGELAIDDVGLVPLP
jgi:hypothetical protein